VTHAEVAKAMAAWKARALPAIQALQHEQGRAAILVKHAQQLIPTLEIAIGRTEEPDFDKNPSTLTHLSGLFDLSRQILLPMQRQEQFYLDTARDHAHVLERLRDEATAVMAGATAIIPDPAALVAKRRELSSNRREIEMLLQIYPNERRAIDAWEREDAELRPKEALQALIEDFAQHLRGVTDLVHLAQLQRGTWLNIGQDLAIAMAQMGRGGAEAKRKWTHSRTDARVQLASIRRVAERAAAYVAASEPHGFMTA